MAKGKNTRALFEVIKQSQEQQARRSNRPAVSAGAGWFAWLKRPPTPAGPLKRKSPRVAPVMREVGWPTEVPPATTSFESGTASTVSSPDATQSADRDFQADPTAERLVAEGAETYDATSADTLDENRDDHVEKVFSPDELAIDATAADGEQRSYLTTLAADPGSMHDTAVTTAIRDDASAAPVQATTDARSIQLSVSYPTLVVASVAAVMVLAAVFLAGRKAAPRIALTGPSLEQLQQGKPSPEVMNLNSVRPETTLSSDEPKRPVVEPTKAKVESEQSQAASPSPDRRRVGGRNYIIAQSYPDPDNAEKAAAVLQKNNIPVTVEQLDAAPGWFCVVTQVGFDRVSTPDCERYQKLIKDLNAQAKSAKLKAFEPYLYKWK